MTMQLHNGTDLAAQHHAPQPRASGSALAPMTFEAMVRMGEQLVKTGFIPEHIRTGAQAAAIIMTGRELGMEPMRALRSLAMVKGKVLEYADSQLARFKTDGGKAKWTKLDETEAVLWLQHPNGDEHTETFTMADAQRAGAGPMYQKHPKAMLRSRAITAGLKSIGWEGGCGTYDPSEMVDESRSARVESQVVPVDAGERPNGSHPVFDERANDLIQRIAAAETADALKALAAEVKRLPPYYHATLREAYAARMAVLKEVAS